MTTDVDRSDRYRLIPTRGIRGPSWFVYGESEAREDAERSFKETGVPVLVCKFPPGGTTEALYTVPPTPRTRRGGVKL